MRDEGEGKSPAFLLSAGDYFTSFRLPHEPCLGPTQLIPR